MASGTRVRRKDEEGGAGGGGKGSTFSFNAIRQECMVQRVCEVQTKLMSIKMPSGERVDEPRKASITVDAWMVCIAHNFRGVSPLFLIDAFCNHLGTWKTGIE